MLSCNGSVERHKKDVQGYININIVLPIGTARGAGVIESIAVSRPSKRPAPNAIVISVRRALSLTSSSEALESPSPGRQLSLLHRVSKTGRSFPRNREVGALT